MSKIAEKVRFGQIGHAPVVIGAGNTYIYNSRNDRWSRLPQGRWSEVIPVRPSTFLKRFGAVVSRLPKSLRHIAPPLQIASEKDQIVGFCRSGSSGYFDRSDQASGSASVTAIEPWLRRRKREQGTFDLGRHHYSSGPGFSWTCEYRIVRLDDHGQLWDIQATSEESDGFESMGTHSLEAAQEYFDGVGFSISRDRWEAMGAKFPAEDAEDDDSCVICGGSLSEVNRMGFHNCNV